jgi:hypothetical protein
VIGAPPRFLGTPWPRLKFALAAFGTVFAAGCDPRCYLAWQSDKTRDIVGSCLQNHPGLDLATALGHLWWAPMG